MELIYNGNSFQEHTKYNETPHVPYSRPSLSTLRSRKNGRQISEDLFKCIFFNENVCISIAISPKFVPDDPINNIPALVWIMIWRRLRDTPLSEPMMIRLPTHICFTQPQWVKLKADVKYVTNIYCNQVGRICPSDHKSLCTRVSLSKGLLRTESSHHVVWYQNRSGDQTDRFNIKGNAVG